MLPESTIQMINQQIAEEMSHLNSIFCDTQQDKMDTLERISKLRSMLIDPTPATVKPEIESHETTIDLASMLDTIRNRFKKYQSK